MVCFERARYLHAGAFVASDITSPTAVGPGSRLSSLHDILVQLGQVHSSSTTSNFGSSLRLLFVQKVALRGASFIHCLMNSSCTFNRSFRNIGPNIMASPGPGALFFRMRSHPHLALDREASGESSSSRRTVLLLSRFHPGRRYT